MNDAPLEPASDPKLPRSGRPARARSLTCPNCGSPITIHANGISITAACPACGTVLDVATEDIRTIATAAARTRTPLIAIGTRGTLCGTEWQVVGYQERSSDGGSWQWVEYLLFNPYRGFRFLSLDHGTWTLYVMLRQTVSDDGTVPGDPRRYRLDTTTTATTDYVLGEFYWRVKAGDSVALREYTAPPYLLSEERSDGEVTWSRGVFIADATVRTAFGLLSPKPASAPAAPKRRYWTVAGVTMLLLILVQSISFGQDHNRQVFTTTFTAAPADEAHALASVAFDMPDAGGNATLRVNTASAFDWLDLKLALVSTDGFHRFEAAIAIERFHGETEQSATFGSVPGGSYKVLATVKPTSFARIGDPPTPTQARAETDLAASSPAFTPASPAPSISFEVEVRRHTVSGVWFVLGSLLVIGWPTAVSIRRGWHRMMHHGRK